MEGKIKINYTLLRELSVIPLKDDYVAYKDNILYDNGKPYHSCEGICLSGDIEKADNDLSKIAWRKYELYKEDIVEACRTSFIFGGEQDKYKIENPYSFIKQHGLGGINLLHVDMSDHTLRDTHHNVLPKSIMFDYIQAGIHNGAYKLKKLGEYLLSRNDIVFYQESYGKSIIIDNDERTLQNIILNIPYYNADDERDKYIYFMWNPTREDWGKIWMEKPYDSGQSWWRYARIKEFLGIEQFRKNV